MIYLGADHGGYKLKEQLKKYFIAKNIPFTDLGNKQLVAEDDYPDYAILVAKAVSKNPQHRGILICSSGQGMCTTANKLPKIRASLGYSVSAVKASRHDGDSNILCLPGKSLSSRLAITIVSNWLNTPFSRLKRHQRRIAKIAKAK